MKPGAGFPAGTSKWNGALAPWLTKRFMASAGSPLGDADWQGIQPGKNKGG
jgi:hypothetical protein